jgi:hypothetical protein
MTIMTPVERVFLAIFGFVVMFSSQAKAENPALERELAVKLIAEANQIRDSEITIGPMQVVDRKVDSSTTVKGGICVTFIAPVIENGGRRRSVQTRTLYYDADWGWYLFAVEKVRGGDAIDVVSEHKGRIELR